MISALEMAEEQQGAKQQVMWLAPNCEGEQSETSYTYSVVLATSLMLT